MNSVLIIVNPKARGKNPETVCGRFQEFLTRQHMPYEVYVTKQHADHKGIQDALLKHQGKYVTAIGGDGTLHDILNSGDKAFEKHIHLLPCGLANNFAKGFYGAVLDPEIFFDRIVHPVVFSVKIGRCNGIAFCNSLGIGIQSKVAAFTHSNKWSFIPSLLRRVLALYLFIGFARPIKASIYSNKELKVLRKSYLNILLLNGSYACSYELLDHQSFQNEHYDLLLFYHQSVLRRLKYFRKVINRMYLDQKHIVDHMTCTQIQIELETELPFVLDGELYRSKSFDIGMNSRPLDLLI